jgi:hypothetical protein
MGFESRRSCVSKARKNMLADVLQSSHVGTQDRLEGIPSFPCSSVSEKSYLRLRSICWSQSFVPSSCCSRDTNEPAFSASER